jgi:hypothetical protein
VSFQHFTIGTDISAVVRNVHFPIENVSLTSVGLSLRRQPYAFPSLAFTLGLTPPGDEGVEIYEVLLSGILSPADGMVWTGSIRSRDLLYIVLNYISTAPVFMFLTWTTTS